MDQATMTVYVEGRRIDVEGTLEELRARARADGGFVWIDLPRARADELSAVAAELDLQPHAVRACLHGHQRSLLEDHGRDLFVVLQPARYLDETETVETSDLGVFAGIDFVVSVVGDGWVDAEALRARLEQQPALLAKGPRGVLWGLCEEVVTGYRPVLAGVENDIDEIEDDLLSDDPEVSRRIFALQRDVIDLQHATGPLASMLVDLRDRDASASVPAYRALADAARHVSDRVDGFRRTLQSALEVNATLVEQRNADVMRTMSELGLQQNDQVKKITSWAAILFAPTLVGTIYGMNFRHMPELEWLWGYPMAIGLMGAMAVVLYVVFKRRDWL